MGLPISLLPGAACAPRARAIGGSYPRIVLLCGVAAALLAVTKCVKAQVGSVTLSSPQVSVPQLRASGKHFLDPSDRAILLRGVSLSGDAKVPPFLLNLTARDVDHLADLGVNVIRLLFIWEAYEPSRNGYDERYLTALIETARLAWTRGIYTVVDIHQDGFSRHASRGAGDGFPLWAISRRARARIPDNSPRSKNWALMMATDRTTYRSFADFFADVDGVRTQYLAMLSRASSRFVNIPGVVGYDLMNEPWGDEPTELYPLYRDATAAIRARHPSAIVFLEGHVTTNCGLQSALPRPEFTNTVYAPHYYKPSAVVLKRWHGNRLAMDRAFGLMTSKAEAWNTPLFLGEFGLDANAYRSGEYVSAIYEHLDAHLASGAQWNFTPGWTLENKDGWNGEDFNIIEPDGRLRPNYRPRPFPRATAGNPLTFEFRRAISPTLVFSWDHDPSRGVTELFLPHDLFPREGTAIQASSDLGLDWDDARQLLLVRSDTPRRVVLKLTGPATSSTRR